MPFDIASPAVLAAALLLDAAIGDPRWLWSRVPHPVALLGAAIGRADRAFNRPGAPARRFKGALLTTVVVAVAAGLGLAVSRLSTSTIWGGVLEALVAFSLIAQRDLHDHVARVAEALRKDGLEGGRGAVSRIVGRDPDALDEAGVCRAAIESCAENFSDGAVAPVFWYLLLGLPGLMAYKAINTLDSMVGHRTDRHLAFGWAAARLDDFVNLAPARLSGLVVAAAAVVARGASPGGALVAMARDARRHTSPNAGWPEAAFAGTLGLAIAGPRRYGGEAEKDAAWMGDGRVRCAPDDIDAALRLYVRACVLWAAVGVGLPVVWSL